MKSVGVTGATGFVGQRFLEYNKERYRLVLLDLRNTAPNQLDLGGLDAIVHLAGKAHQMQPIPEQVYFDVNLGLTRQLADQALAQGVKNFIYISSVKVYGDEPRGILTEVSDCIPSDPYGASKWQAEQYLQTLQQPGFTVSIVRPPLVYGPGVKGNMIRLLQLADKKWPLPFGASANARSMVYLDNLVALINKIVDEPAAGIFVAGDEKPVETSDLIRMIRQELGNKAPLFSIPGVLRTLIKKWRPGLYIRLFGSYVIDNSATNRALNFLPPVTTAAGVKAMTQWYLRSSR
ncbi:MAG: NAD-dependent epimerase/dehydratase family protein [Bacteroidota bacterium]|nr:NAD-dependent epimerase/dehydratase family protein [Bacteroidota bacterium]